MITGVNVCWNCFYSGPSVFSYCPMCGRKLRVWSNEWDKASLKHFDEVMGRGPLVLDRRRKE